MIVKLYKSMGYPGTMDYCEIEVDPSAFDSREELEGYLADEAWDYAVEDVEAWFEIVKEDEAD